MAVTHSFECAAHGGFEARVAAGAIPSCPRGCSPYFVKLVFVSPPSIGSERVRTATRLIKEMAETQGLSDIDHSPSRPGVSVADRNWKKNNNKVTAFAGGDLAKFLATAPHDNVLNRAGFGHPYNPGEWREGKHLGSSSPPEKLPTEVVRVRE
jgi:hypothetical protein